MSKESLKIDNTDFNREGLTFSKIVHTFNVFFNKKYTEVLESVSVFCNINFDKLRDLWKKGIILDIDDCIAPHHWKIYRFNIEKIKELLSNEWKIIIFSNMKKSDRYEELEKLWIPVITSWFAKPDSRGYSECLDKLNLSNNEVVMIWDNFLTDWGSIWAWIDFIKVKPINRDNWKQSLWRKTQIIMRNFADKIAKVRGNI